jgi:crossover junction endodeoxyribonuclease RuvC
LSPPSELVIGIDPGSRATGFGLVRPEGRRIVMIECGVIRPGPDDDLGTRLALIARRIEALVAEHAPTHGAIEDVFVSRDPRAALKLGQARGAALVALACSGLSVASYPPAVVKRAVTGSGRADKDQVGRMVRALLGLPGRPAKDATDALAVAICHLRSLR